MHELHLRSQQCCGDCSKVRARVVEAPKLWRGLRRPAATNSVSTELIYRIGRRFDLPQQRLLHPRGNLQIAPFRKVRDFHRWQYLYVSRK
jgi:hypothetical protein